MGGLQKALMVVEGRAIVDRQLEALAGRVTAIAVALAPASDSQTEFEARGLLCLRDREPDLGPIAGLSVALEWADGQPLLAIACDMPFLTSAALELILSRGADADLAVPWAQDRWQPLLASYGAAMRPVTEAAIRRGSLRLADLPDAARAAGLRVDEIHEAELRTRDPDLASLRNFNRPSDPI